MTEKQARPPGTPWLMPFLVVREPRAMLAFYEKAFGFTTKNAHEDEAGNVFHAEMTWHDAVIMFGPEGDPTAPGRAPATEGVAPGMNLYVYCDDVDALFARAREAGAGVKSLPEDMFWGDRMCSLTDPAGHVWNFATHIGAPAGG